MSDPSERKNKTAWQWKTLWKSKLSPAATPAAEKNNPVKLFLPAKVLKKFLPSFSKTNAVNLPTAAAANIAYIHESAILTSSPQILVC